MGGRGDKLITELGRQRADGVTSTVGHCGSRLDCDGCVTLGRQMHSTVS